MLILFAEAKVVTIKTPNNILKIKWNDNMAKKERLGWTNKEVKLKQIESATFFDVNNIISTTCTVACTSVATTL